MSGIGRITKFIAFGLMMLFAVVAVPFVIGEIVLDPGGWAAAGLLAAFIVPLLALSAIAAIWPAVAVRVLEIVVGLFAVYSISNAFAEFVPRDVGPSVAIAAIAISIPLAVLGLNRPIAAGLMLLATGVVTMAELFITAATHADGGGGGIGFALGGSSGSAALPALMIGTLFLVAGVLAESGRTHSRPAHS